MARITKNAQLQMGETIFVVIFIIILIVFGLVFSSNATEDTVNQKKEKMTDLNSITLSKYASSLIEVQCSTLGVIDASCFDEYKLNAFTNLTKNDPAQTAEYYFSQFKNANITVKEIFPETNRTWQIYYNDLGINHTKKAKRTTMPVNILDPVTKKMTFGELIITSFTK